MGASVFRKTTSEKLRESVTKKQKKQATATNLGSKSRDKKLKGSKGQFSRQDRTYIFTTVAWWTIARIAASKLSRASKKE